MLTSSYKACTKENILASRDTIQSEIIFWLTGLKADDQKHRAPSWLRVDNNPGCFFGLYKGMIQFVDFAHKYLGYKHALNCFDLTMLRYNCDFNSALRLINQHFGLGLAGGKKLEINHKQIESFKNIQITRKTTTKKGWKPIKYTFKVFDTWPESYLDYWASFNIDEDTLKAYNILPIHSYRRNGRIVANASIKDPIFAYKINDIAKANNIAYKIYRPLADKGNKWRTNTSTNHIQGFSELFTDVKYISKEHIVKKNNEEISKFAYVPGHETDTLIITKSMKDVMVLKRLGYNSIAPQAEGHNLPKELMELIKLTYDNIYLLYDNDSAGKEASKTTAEKHDLKEIFIPDHLSYKDISDFIKGEGVDTAKLLIENLISDEPVRPIYQEFTVIR